VYATGYFDLLVMGEAGWGYFVNKRIIKYYLSTHECQDLGVSPPLEGVFFHEGSIPLPLPTFPLELS